MKKTLLHSAILAALTLSSANADGFKSGESPAVKQETTQKNVEPLKVEIKDIAKDNHTSGSEELKADVAKLKTSTEQHQNFIWDQEKINKDQETTNRTQKEINEKLAGSINKTIDAVNNKTSSNDDYNRLRSRINDLEYANDRLKSAINSYESRLNSLERKVR